MSKEKLLANEEPEIKKTCEKKQISLQVDIPNDGNLVVCEVCGHKNSKDIGMCAMCSNYLFN